MNSVVCASGSSPAYVFMFIEALADSAVKCGLPRKDAYEFVAQTVLGSAKLMLETGKHPGRIKGYGMFTWRNNYCRSCRIRKEWI